jgi:hypothetical protein
MLVFAYVWLRAFLQCFYFYGEFGASGSRLHHSSKAGNLAICFVGFASEITPKIAVRAAELGTMSSIFDLVSDKLGFEDFAADRYIELCDKVFNPKIKDMLVNLLQAKKFKMIPRDGLQRGEVALVVVLEHLGELEKFERSWDPAEVGELLQIVDDLLDYDVDTKSGHLNFLKGNNAEREMCNLVQFKLSRIFAQNARPRILLKAIGWAEAIAIDRLKEIAAHRSTKPPEVKLSAKAM